MNDLTRFVSLAVAEAASGGNKRKCSDLPLSCQILTFLKTLRKTNLYIELHSGLVA